MCGAESPTLTTGRKVDGDTLFPVFSVVKAVTATALHIQAERGLIEYDKPIAHYWPEFAKNGKGKATVTDALSHRLGLHQMPEGVTPARMADYYWMVYQLAAMAPDFEPGTRNAYMCYTFGWVIAELVCRTDPKLRPFGRFVQEEICAPLGIKDLWIGIPGEVEPRIARLIDAPPTGMPPDALFFKCIPPRSAPRRRFSDAPRCAVHAFRAREESSTPAARRACSRCSPTAASWTECDCSRRSGCARFSNPRPNTDEPDMVLGFPVRVGTAGYWLGGAGAAAVVGANPRTLCHPGAGGSIGWANPDLRLAGAICHNRMFNGPDDPFAPIAQAIRQTFGE